MSPGFKALMISLSVFLIIAVLAGCSSGVKTVRCEEKWCVEKQGRNAIYRKCEVCR